MDKLTIVEPGFANYIDIDCSSWTFNLKFIQNLNLRVRVSEGAKQPPIDAPL